MGEHVSFVVWDDRSLHGQPHAERSLPARTLLLSVVLLTIVVENGYTRTQVNTSWKNRESVC